MKGVRYLPQARKAMLRHRAEADRIQRKMADYASDPASQANNVKRLRGRQPQIFRLRVGDFRVLFTEDKDAITVIDIGPRSGIYE